jgi:hypothetical protein
VSAAHAWDAESKWKSPDVTVSADRKTVTIPPSPITFTSAVGRFTFGDRAAETFAVTCTCAGVSEVFFGLVKRSGLVDPPDWPVSSVVHTPVGLFVMFSSAARDDVRLWTRLAHQDRYHPAGRLETGQTAVTCTFTVDRERGTVDLLLNGQRVREQKPLWTEKDIDSFTPIVTMTGKAAVGVSFVACPETIRL